jgi:hypothetical protein
VLRGELTGSKIAMTAARTALIDVTMTVPVIELKIASIAEKT